VGDSAMLDKLRLHQEVLREISHLCSQTLPAANLLHDVVVQVSRAVEIDHVKILRYRPESGDLLIEAGVGWRDGVVGHATFSVDLASPPGSAFQTGQPVFIADLPRSKEFRSSSVLAEHGIISVLNVPILVNGAAWGVLEIDSTVHCNFSGDTQIFMMTAAAIVATTLRWQHMAVVHDAAMAKAAFSNKADMMLGEMQHRVKNNFQTILALITFGRRGAAPPTETTLSKLADNIIAMSLAHDQLAISQANKSVNLPNYLGTLAARIKKPMDGVIVEVKAEEFEVPVEQAVPLGLIMNELITNAGKHAFDATRSTTKGVIMVELSRGTERGTLRLAVSDNGKGTNFPETGSGLSLIDGLARQIRGRCERKSTSGAGTLTTIIFPVV
jgi:two-component sensor histidine kinase